MRLCLTWESCKNTPFEFLALTLVGQVGVHLSKELMAIAGYSLKANITTLGPLVLPVSEQLTFLAYLFARKVRPHTLGRIGRSVLQACGWCLMPWLKTDCFWFVSVGVHCSTDWGV